MHKIYVIYNQDLMVVVGEGGERQGFFPEHTFFYWNCVKWI